MFAGFLPASREAIVAALQGCDFVLVLGAPVFTYHVEGFGPYLPEGASLVQIVDDPATAARTPVGQAIISNVADAIAALNAAADPATRTARLLTEPALDESITGPGIGEALLMQRLTELRPKGLIVSEGSPPPRAGRCTIISRSASTTSSWRRPAAASASPCLPQSARRSPSPTARSSACSASGSAMYSIQGLWTAADLKLDVRFLIVNNGGYAALDQFGALFDIEVVGSKLPGLDFVKLAEGMGVPGAA